VNSVLYILKTLLSIHTLLCANEDKDHRHHQYCHDLCLFGQDCQLFCSCHNHHPHHLYRHLFVVGWEHLGNYRRHHPHHQYQYLFEIDLESMDNYQQCPRCYHCHHQCHMHPLDSHHQYFLIAIRHFWAVVQSIWDAIIVIISVPCIAFLSIAIHVELINSGQ